MDRCWSFWCKDRAGCTKYQAEHRCSTSCKSYACRNCRLLEDTMLCDRFRFPAYADTHTQAVDKGRRKSIWTYARKPRTQRNVKEKPPDKSGSTE